jgi:hypothetical protein
MCIIAQKGSLGERSLNAKTILDLGYGYGSESTRTKMARRYLGSDHGMEGCKLNLQKMGTSDTKTMDGVFTEQSRICSLDDPVLGFEEHHSH